MKLDAIHRVHLLGIGGIGMSALARYFLQKGVAVSGYDRTASDLTDELKNEGASVHFEDDAEAMPVDLLQESPEHVLVIRSLAIGQENRELNFFQKRGYHVQKRPKVLAEIAKEYKCIAVSGTHGKTTTGCMLVELLYDCGIPCHALLGAVSARFGSNVWLEGEAEHIVVEADEYGRSFLELEPDTAIITALEADHLDVYGDKQGLQEAFFEFQRKVSNEGRLILEEHVPVAPDLEVSLSRFGRGEDVDLRVVGAGPEAGLYRFGLVLNGKTLKKLPARMPGLHNVLDLSAAIAVAMGLGANEDTLRDALEKVEGVRRRFEFHLETEEHVLIEDYAHHPTEIDAVIRTARELYPDRSIAGIFQPHLYSRTRDHAEGFGKTLSSLDQVLLLPIYPAREAPISGVSSEMLLEWIQGPVKAVIEKDEIIARVHGMAPDVLLILGAGDISQEVGDIKGLLTEIAEKES